MKYSQRLSIAISNLVNDGSLSASSSDHSVLTAYALSNKGLATAILAVNDGKSIWGIPFDDVSGVVSAMRQFAWDCGSMGYLGKRLFAKVAKVLAKVSVDDALSLLEINRSDASNPKALKKAYREAASINHPDRGGSTDKMQLVNQAYDLLKKLPAGSEGLESFEERMYREGSEAVKKANAAGDHLESILDTKKFSDYFEEQTGKKFKSKVARIDSDTHLRNPSTGKSETSKIYKGHKITWTSEDGDTVFHISMHPSISWIRTVNQLGSSDDKIMAYDMVLVQEIVHNNRKSKFKQSEVSFTNRQRDLLDPEFVFPAKKIKAMLKGKDKKRKFSKRDMLTGIDKYLDGRVSYRGKQIWAEIPLGPVIPDDEIGWGDAGPMAIREKNYNRNILSMYRYTFGRGHAGWEIYGVQGPRVAKKNRVMQRTQTSSLTENEDLLVALRSLVKETKDVSDLNQIAREFDRAASKLKDQD